MNVPSYIVQIWIHSLRENNRKRVDERRGRMREEGAREESENKRRGRMRREGE